MCAEGWIDNTPKWVLVRDVQEMTHLYKTGSQNTIALSPWSCFLVSPKYSTVRAQKKEENICKGHPRRSDSGTSQDGPSSGTPPEEGQGER